MPSLRTLSKIALGGAQVILGNGGRVMGEYTQTCPNAQLSCHNTTVVENLCCFNAPGGQILRRSSGMLRLLPDQRIAGQSMVYGTIALQLLFTMHEC